MKRYTTIRSMLKNISSRKSRLKPEITVRTVEQLVDLVKEENIKTTNEYKEYAKNHNHVPKNPLLTIKGLASWKDIWELAWGIVHAKVSEYNGKNWIRNRG